MMRARIFFALLFLYPLCVQAQSKVSRGMALDQTGAIRVYNPTGTVTVRGWNRDSVAVRGTLGRGDEIHMGGSRTGMKMFIEGIDDRNPEPANIELMVPARAKVWVKTASASVDVRDVNGSLDLYVVSGDIRVAGNPADVNAEAIDGSITITGSPAWVRAKSASGNVTFNGSSSDMSATTVSGKISVTGKQFEKVKVESVTGDIQLTGGIERAGLATIDSHSGTVTVSLPSRWPTDLDAVSIAGTISNRFSTTKPKPGRYGRGAELVTDAFGGGARIVVRSFKGVINFETTK